ncbi:hypothetical protein [Brachyspira pulli]|uniref:hypothetical protein n=1 Tax=Brachyspira pulli TaxID=310721 RepID=UPI0030076B0E
MNDTPASILFDKSLSNGFSEGDKDKETEISIIESFRENKLTPLYNLTDYYVMLKAWDSAFIDDMRYKYSEYQDKTDSEIFRSWADNFTYKYGNLFPEPESITQDNNAKKLDNLLKAQQLGANIADIQEELNESEIFKNEMELDSQPQEMGGIEGAEESDNDLFDYTQNEAVQNDSSIKADSDNYFKEEDHERDKDGKFTKKGSGEDNKQGDKEETDKKDSSEEEKQKEEKEIKEKEIKEKIDKVYSSDLSKACILPELTTSIQKKYDFTNKQISLKENIIIKNNNRHNEITEELAKDILSNSLYKPEYILKGNPEKQNYHNFITRIGEDKNTIVLLDIDETKDYYEIVNYHIIDDDGIFWKKKKDEKIRNKKS